VPVAWVRTELVNFRTEEGPRVESVSGDANFKEALKTNDHDLVDQPRKLNPVIGRDEEIHRMVHILSRHTTKNHVLIGETN
jgi:ATP-dependent Clp protease ATP-binding subunit ClpB